MKFVVVSLFPDLVMSYFQEGIMARALEKKLITVETVNPRDFINHKYKSADDRPFGGGDGMLLLPEPFFAAVEAAQSRLLSQGSDSIYKIALSPQGKVLNEQMVTQLAAQKKIILVCGRYAGFDQRFLNTMDCEISLGDFVLSGGELAALAVIEAVSRKVSGVLGDSQSFEYDSFTAELFGLLEGPSFTKPDEFLQQKVPAILKSGHHQNIKMWKLQVALLVTLSKRPDIFAKSWPEVKKQTSLTAIKLVEFYWQLKDNDELSSVGLNQTQSAELEKQFEGLR